MNVLFVIVVFVISFPREDRGKVDVRFTIKFKKDTKYPLKPLYEQIEKDYLGNMPVYRDTLVRGGTILRVFLLHVFYFMCSPPILLSVLLNRYRWE
jgi:hypothetical protein